MFIISISIAASSQFYYRLARLCSASSFYSEPPVEEPLPRSPSATSLPLPFLSMLFSSVAPLRLTSSNTNGDRVCVLVLSFPPVDDILWGVTLIVCVNIPIRSTIWELTVWRIRNCSWRPSRVPLSISFIWSSDKLSNDWDAAPFRSCVGKRGIRPLGSAVRGWMNGSVVAEDVDIVGCIDWRGRVDELNEDCVWPVDDCEFDWVWVVDDYKINIYYNHLVSDFLIKMLWVQLP